MIGEIVHFFPANRRNAFHYDGEEKCADCVAAIIARDSRYYADDGPLQELVVFDDGVQTVRAPHHTDYDTREYADYEVGSWHKMSECKKKTPERGRGL